jgi:hypothetical protein
MAQLAITRDRVQLNRDSKLPHELKAAVPAPVRGLWSTHRATIDAGFNGRITLETIDFSPFLSAVSVTCNNQE